MASKIAEQRLRRQDERAARRSPAPDLPWGTDPTVDAATAYSTTATDAYGHASESGRRTATLKMFPAHADLAGSAVAPKMPDGTWARASDTIGAVYRLPSPRKAERRQEPKLTEPPQRSLEQQSYGVERLVSASRGREGKQTDPNWPPRYEGGPTAARRGGTQTGAVSHDPNLLSVTGMNATAAHGTGLYSSLRMTSEDLSDTMSSLAEFRKSVSDDGADRRRS